MGSAAEEAETTSKTVRVVKTTNISGEVSEEVSKTEGGNKKVSLINRDYLAADNMNEFLKVRNTELLMKEAVADGPAAPLFYDATFSKAIKDVRNRVTDLDFRTWTFGLGLLDLDFRTW